MYMLYLINQYAPHVPSLVDWKVVIVDHHKWTNQNGATSPCNDLLTNPGGRVAPETKTHIHDTIFLSTH